MVDSWIGDVEERERDDGGECRRKGESEREVVEKIWDTVHNRNSAKPSI